MEEGLGGPFRCPRCGTPMAPTTVACVRCHEQRAAAQAVRARPGAARRSGAGSVVLVILVLALVGGAAYATVAMRGEDRTSAAPAGDEEPDERTPAEQAEAAERAAFFEALERQEARREALLGFCDAAGAAGYGPQAEAIRFAPAYRPGDPNQWLLIFGGEISLQPNAFSTRYGELDHAAEITLAVCRHPSEPIDTGRTCTYVERSTAPVEQRETSTQRLMYTVSIWTVYELRTGTRIGETRSGTGTGVTCKPESTMGTTQVDAGQYSESNEGWVRDHLTGGTFR